ncbi:MAG: hypothetical protein IIU03_01495 [Bacteroidales bacterium]|nr:hypothetical protein [Bacteroidales bacterium]
MRQIKTLIVKFSSELKKHEIPLFRGAVIAASGGSQLFHNHDGDNYRYSYPLIQYKRIGKNPAIVCIGQGVETIGELFSNGNFTFQIGERTLEMEILSIKANKTAVQLWNSEFHYTVENWLPLNSENYKKYNALVSETEKNALLENILKGNILSFLKSMDIFLEDELLCRITEVSKVRTERYKNLYLMSFDLSFLTNISLPYLIGLGKNASLGFGVVRERKFQHGNDFFAG